jgi:molybdopterin-dependent oxidoreductase alpha subunit
MSRHKISSYNGPAGGWGALKSVGRQLVQHDIPVAGPRTLLRANRDGGFDCPGCAWPDGSEGRALNFCENGVKAIAAEITSARANPARISQYTVAQLREWDDHALEALGRLTDPLVFDPSSDRYVEIAWDEAFRLIGSTLQGLDSPDEALFYTSGRTSNEAAFLYQLFVREYGTNNFPDCSNLCHEPSGVGLRSGIGVGKGTVSLEDFEHADMILVLGQNPGTNHPRMLGTLHKAARRGATIVSFNPLKERGLERFADPQDMVEMMTLGSTRISSRYLQVKIGGDIAALEGICKRVIELDIAAAPAQAAQVLDHAFIEQHAKGFDSYARYLAALSWDDIVRDSGLQLDEIFAVAQTYAAAHSVIACWGMGITQHRHGADAVRAIVNLLLLRGNIGRKGAGVCPVRGHSNVQGDRTMGIDEKPSESFLQRLDAAFGITSPRKPGLDTVGAIEAMRDGRAKVFVGMGGNFAAATPDTQVVEDAMSRCRLTVHISTKLNRSHLVRGERALVLPCLGRTELDLQATGLQSVSVEDSMSVVHLSTGINPPASSNLLSEPMIVARMAEATMPDTRVPWRWLVEDYDRVRAKIEQVIPGFEHFNVRVRLPGGFRLPNPAAARFWATDSGRANFLWRIRSNEVAFPVASGSPVFTLATIRSHDQYNTTVYDHDDRYRGVFGLRRVIFINREDIRQLQMREGDWVDIRSVWGDGRHREVSRFKLVPYDIPRGCVAAYYPETNALVPMDAHDPEARTPASKSIPVVLLPAPRGPRGEAA